MASLEESIKQAMDSQGATGKANKAYLEFIKANFIIPVEKNSIQEEPKVLFYQEMENTFLPAFTDDTYFNQWADEIKERIEVLRLSGVDLLKGVGENVTVCLNIGSPVYKEFNPSEIARMRSMVLKIFK